MPPKDAEDVISRVDIVLPKKVVDTCHGLDPGIGAEFLAMNYQKGTASRMKLFKQFDESVRLSLIVSKLQLYSGPEHILIQGVRKPQRENAVQAEDFSALGMKTSEVTSIQKNCLTTSQPVDQQEATSVVPSCLDSSRDALASSTLMPTPLPAVSSMDSLASTINVILNSNSVLDQNMTTEETSMGQPVMNRDIPMLNTGLGISCVKTSFCPTDVGQNEVLTQEIPSPVDTAESVIHDGTVGGNEMADQAAMVMSVVSVSEDGALDVIMEQEVVSTEAVLDDNSAAQAEEGGAISVEMEAPESLSSTLVLEDTPAEDAHFIVLRTTGDVESSDSANAEHSNVAMENVQMAANVSEDQSSMFVADTEVYSISKDGNTTTEYFANDDDQRGSCEAGSDGAEMLAKEEDEPESVHQTSTSDHAASLEMNSCGEAVDAAQKESSEIVTDSVTASSSSSSLPPLPNLLNSLGIKTEAPPWNVSEKRKRKRPLRFQDSAFINDDDCDGDVHPAKDVIRDGGTETDERRSQPASSEKVLRKPVKIPRVAAKRPHYKRERNIACPLCPSKLKDYESVSDHLRLKHGRHREFARCLEEIKPYMKVRCEACGKTYSNKDQLQAHTLLMHQKMEQAKCEQCGLIVKSQKHLKGHMKRVHAGLEHMYLCHLCPASFRVQAYLSTHLKYVHGKPAEASFQCDVCCKKYTTEKYLINHQIRVHGEKRHACGYCSKAFTTSCNMKRHMLLMHEKANIKLNKCHSCPKSFALKANLKDHIRVVHERKYNYQCNICGGGFRRQKEFDVHKESHAYNSKFVTVPADMLKYKTVDTDQLWKPTDELNTAEVELNSDGNNVLTIIESRDGSGESKVGEDTESVQYIIATPDMLHAFGIKLDSVEETVIEET